MEPQRPKQPRKIEDIRQVIKRNKLQMLQPVSDFFVQFEEATRNQPRHNQDMAGDSFYSPYAPDIMELFWRMMHGAA